MRARGGQGRVSLVDRKTSRRIEMTQFARPTPAAADYDTIRSRRSLVAPCGCRLLEIHAGVGASTHNRFLSGELIALVTTGDQSVTPLSTFFRSISTTSTQSTP